MVSAGYMMRLSYPQIVYNKRFHEQSLAWTTIFSAFNELTYLVILVSLLTLAFFLSFTSSKCFPKLCFLGLVSSVQAVFGQSFDQELFLISNRKWSRSILIFCLSFLGVFIYWCFTGVLTSLLTVPTENSPLTSLDELHVKNNYKIPLYRVGAQMARIKEWKEKPENRQIFETNIRPYLYDEIIDGMIIAARNMSFDGNFVYIGGKEEFIQTISQSKPKTRSEFCKLLKSSLLSRLCRCGSL